MFTNSLPKFSSDFISSTQLQALQGEVRLALGERPEPRGSGPREPLEMLPREIWEHALGTKNRAAGGSYQGSGRQRGRGGCVSNAVPGSPGDGDGGYPRHTRRQDKPEMPGWPREPPRGWGGRGGRQRRPRRTAGSRGGSAPQPALRTPHLLRDGLRAAPRLPHPPPPPASTGSVWPPQPCGTETGSGPAGPGLGGRYPPAPLHRIPPPPPLLPGTAPPAHPGPHRLSPAIGKALANPPRSATCASSAGNLLPGRSLLHGSPR